MDPEILKTVGEVAGIGGISLGVVLLVFREVIRKNVFPKLPAPEAYRLLRLIVVLTFGIGIAGLGAWVVTNRQATPSFTNVTNIGTIQNEFLAVMGQPLNDPVLEKLIQQALELTAKGDAKASIPLYREAIEKAPLPSLYNNLGAALAQQNSDEEARKALQGALAKNSSYAPAMDNLKALDSRPPPQPLSIGSRESEPNDDVFHANIMKLNTGVSAAIEPASDVDTFQIESEGKSRDWIDVTFENRSNGLQPQMRILQLNKEELVPWNRAATAGADHSIAFVAAPNTKYFVQVSSVYGQSAGAYVLTVKPRHAFDRYEPNDDIAHATPIRVGSPVEQANIMDGGDQDFYQFESGAAGDMTVTIQNDSTTLAPEARVLDSSRSDITGWKPNGNAGGHLKFSFKAAAKSVYYVDVGANYGQSAGSYTLTVQ